MSAICDAHKKKVHVELLYNSVHRKFNQLDTRCGRESQHPADWALWPPIESWGSDELEIRCGRENQHPERLSPQAPPLSSPGEQERNAVMANRVGVNMLQFCSVSVSLSHTTLSIKWEVYFSKELCRFSLLCRCFLHVYVYVFVLLVMVIQHIYVCHSTNKVSFCFFILCHMNLRGLFNMKVIIVE